MLVDPRRFRFGFPERPPRNPEPVDPDPVEVPSPRLEKNPDVWKVVFGLKPVEES